MNHINLALRQLRLRPSFSIVVIVMLALGIGATTAMFSLYHQILLRPLPVPEPERLVNLAAPGPKLAGSFRDLAIGDPDAMFSYPMFRDLERGQTVFTGLAAHSHFMANLSFEDQPVFDGGWLVSGSYFSVLGLQPALGRLIGPEDEPRAGESTVVVLSYEYWQSMFGGDASVLGKRLSVNGHDLTIIGVAPEGFTGTNLGTRPQVFVPLTLRWLTMNWEANPDERRDDWAYLFGRLKPGVTAEQAAAELNSLYAGILDEIEVPLLRAPTLPPGTLERFRAKRIVLSSGAEGTGNIRATAARPLALLLGVTALVLLIVCVNIANLLLARGAARGGEMAIRASIGASRAVLVRQMLAESLVLIAIGGALSLVVAELVVRLITGMLPEGTAGGLAPELSSAALLFAALASLLTVLVFGLVPAWRVSGTSSAQAINGQARGSSGRGAVRFRGALTTAQIAFSMVLLVLAGLFTRSLVNVAREDLGMSVDSIVVFAITPKQNAYDAERLAALYDRVEERVTAQPGVLAVGSTGVPLLRNFVLGGGNTIEGMDAVPGADTFAAFNIAGDGYFDALGVPLRAGRVFSERDTSDAPPVVIVNESFVRKFNLEDPVGKRIGQPDPQGVVRRYLEIVGVVADAKLGSVKDEMSAIVYYPRRQVAGAIEAMFYYVRTDFDPAALFTTIPRLVAEIDPDVPVSQLNTMRMEVDNNVYIDRLLSMLSAGFAALATLLAGIGLYGVLAYNVAQRTRELGLRLALGAAPARLRTLVLRQVGVMALIGAGVGLAAALALGRVAEAVLFGLSGHDPLVIAAAVIVLGAVVLAGAWLPARRAARIAPTEALRYE